MKPNKQGTHSMHETSIQPDLDNSRYREWCHDCKEWVQ
jgi:hypothetical protein